MSELIHYGIPGQKKGVRRWTNPDGTLNEAGKKRYYKSDKYGGYDLNMRGRAFNKKQNQKFDRYKNSVVANMRQIEGKRLKDAVDEYRYYLDKNSEHRAKNQELWESNKGKFKGKTYNQFKDMSLDEWNASKDGKAQVTAYKKLRKIVDSAAKEHPLYSKTYGRLASYGPARMDYEKIGKSVVDSIMADYYLGKLK